MQTTVYELLRQHEGRHLDFKRAEVDPIKALKTVCAFANTAGGYLLIGVSDDREVLGVPDIAKQEERYASLLSDRIHPYLSVDIQRVEVNGSELLILRVPRFPGAFRLQGKGGGVFVRQGSTNRTAGPERVAELEREATARSWDERACVDASIEDIDRDQIEALYALVGKEVSEAKLRTLKLLVEHDSMLKPSNAGIILFGTAEARHRLMPHARFRAARFAGDTKAEILDQFDEAAYSLIEALGGNREEPEKVGPLRTFIRRNTRNRAVIGAEKRRDIREYSDAILREVLPNAIAHADFSQRGITPRLMIFRNRLEVENPGGWPIGFAVADFKAGVSKIRNPTIARVLHDLKYFEGWGSGYERIMASCSTDGYPEPEWIEQGAVLKVRMISHPETIDAAINVSKIQPSITKDAALVTSADLNKRQEWFLNQISKGASVSAAELANHFEVSPRTAERDIRQLRDQELVVYVGAAKTGRYVPIQR